MKLKKLTEQHLIEIVKLYEEHCGFGRDFKDAMYHGPFVVLKRLREQGNGGYRVSSKWDGDSKIYFETDFEGNLVVRFDSNFDPRDRKGKQYEDAEKSGEVFVKSAMQYLSSQ